MNTNLGLIGKKLGNTQIFTDDGTVRRVTAILAGPCVVLSKRTEDKDGYSALQLGFGKKREKLVRKPQMEFFTKVGVKPVAVIREFRLPADELAKYEVGQEMKLGEVFTEGQFVDVGGVSKGKGFQGVMKRHNFSGAGTVGHGAHEAKRHGGSIGMNMTPGRVFKGMKMPGQHGNKKHTVLNLKVAKVLVEEGIILVEGGVPGGKHAIVTLRGAVKKFPEA